MSDAQWHEWRRQGIGGSDIAAILGISPYRGPWSVWAEKVGLVTPDDDPTDAMRFGKYAEKMIVPWFTDETGLYVVGEQTWCEHRDKRWMHATVDGFVVESPTSSASDALGPIQIKTDSFARWPEGEIPPHVYAQVQWEIAVTDSERAWLAVLRGHSLQIVEVERDYGYIAEITAEAERFWLEHVVAGGPPVPTADDLDTIRDAWPEAMPEAVAELPAEAVDRWLATNAVRKAAEKQEDEAKAQVLALLEDHELGEVDGQIVVSAKAQTRTTTCKACGHKETSDPFRVLRPVAATKRSRT